MRPCGQSRLSVGAEFSHVVGPSRRNRLGGVAPRAIWCLRRLLRKQLGSPDKGSVSGMRVIGSNRQTDNNGLEQTGRVGVPASRAVVLSAPCSSTQCYVCREAVTLHEDAGLRRERSFTAPRKNMRGQRAAVVFGWPGVQPSGGAAEPESTWSRGSKGHLVSPGFVPQTAWESQRRSVPGMRVIVSAVSSERRNTSIMIFASNRREIRWNGNGPVTRGG